MTLAEVLYLLCAAMSLAVAAMLLRQYLRVRTRLVLWSFLCFTGLAVNNVLVYIDLVMYTGVDLSVYRSAAGAAGMLMMVYGLVWESRK
jgi:uncharacterized protein DUF5985